MVPIMAKSRILPNLQADKSKYEMKWLERNIYRQCPVLVAGSKQSKNNKITEQKKRRLLYLFTYPREQDPMHIISKHKPRLFTVL